MQIITYMLVTFNKTFGIVSKRRAMKNRSHHFLRFLVLAMLPIFLIFACSTNKVENVGNTSATGSLCQIVKHDVGETKICGQPQKVVVIGPHMLDILLSLGMQPVGYAESEPFKGSQFDNPTKQIPYFGSRVTSKPANIGRRGEPSLEVLIKVKPDLILGENFGQEYYAKLSQVAPTLLFKGSLKDEWQRSMGAIAKALGREEQAQQVIAEHKQKIATARAKLASVVAAHPRVLLLGSNDLKEYIQVRSDAEYSAGLLKDLGFQLVLPPGVETTTDGKQLSLEVLPQLNADTIIVETWNNGFPPYDLEKVKREWSQTPITQTMQASRENRVYFVDYHLWSNIRGPISTELILDEVPKLLKNT